MVWDSYATSVPNSQPQDKTYYARNDARRLRMHRRHLNAILHLFRNVKKQQRVGDGQEQRRFRQEEPRTDAPSKPKAHGARIALSGFPIDGDVAFRPELERLRISLCIVQHVPVKKNGDVRTAAFSHGGRRSVYVPEVDYNYRSFWNRVSPDRAVFH